MRKDAKLIQYTHFPPYFTEDSENRRIFKPQNSTHATVEQIRALLSDAEYYADRCGPDQCPAGLKSSARAVIKACRNTLVAYYAKETIS